MTVKWWNCAWKYAFWALAQYLRLSYEWQLRCSRACLKAWISPRHLPEVSAMKKTVFHVSSWFNVWSSGSKGGFVNADKTKARFYSGNSVPFRYFDVATSVQDSSLLPHRKWHEVCWWLPFDSLQWSRWPNVSPCEGGEKILTLHSQ